LIYVQHLKGLVWRLAGKFACCVFGQGTYAYTFELLDGIAYTFEWLDW